MDILKIILTSLFSASALFVIAKILGHKQMAQLDLFDYVNGITIGSIAAEMATEIEAPWKPFLAMMVYGFISVCLSIITNKSLRMRNFINGTPTIIMNDGKLYRKNMKKAKLDLSEFMVMCRQEGYFNMEDIQTAIFEYNGRLTILPKSDKRPINPNDMNLPVQRDEFFTEIIMDGRVLTENLEKLGLNITWLENQLSQANYKSVKEIYLGVCDNTNKLILFDIKN